MSNPEATAPSGLKGSDEITLAVRADTDGDGLPDDYESLHPPLQAGLADPDLDTDKDGLTALGEFQAGTNPDKPDTDGDGALDRDELRLGSNPVDPTSKPLPVTLAVSTTALEFGVCPGTAQTLCVTTATPDLAWSVASAVAGLEITPRAGTGSANLQLLWRCDGLEPGIQADDIWLTSPGSQPRRVKVQITVPGGPVPEPDVTLSSLPDLTLPCDGTGFATASFEPQLILSGSSAVILETVPPSGSRFPLGETKVTVKVTSFSGTQESTFRVKVLPAAPVLALRRDREQIVLTWSVACGAPVLESVDELGGAAAWNPLGATPERTGDQVTVRLPLPAEAGRKFYRLRLP